MTASMTAFGRQETVRNWGTAAWEVRSVNHRYLEMTVRLPEDLRSLETNIREKIAGRISRGKVDCNLRFEPGDSGAEQIELDTALVDRLLTAVKALSDRATSPVNPFDILRWPGVVRKSGRDIDEMVGDILELLDETLESMVQTRRREGAKIRELLLDRCAAVTDVISAIRARIPEIVQTLRERYRERARELQVELDRDRLEQEILLLTQKMDVTEELDRLVAHVDEVRDVLDQKQPAGRRLDFLMQEMNREANTLGSKSAGIDMTNAAVELKVLIDQMREQIQNVE